ncbi:hypothetical protein IWX90DRAFT_486883 [Phyllosticta citrichinensis]|uniref:Uncharacterized protein n=1 Tax=Phyllosticta citrichinensis TaxID=1130410 RepID=A0ABR1XUR3_9PEZI
MDIIQDWAAFLTAQQDNSSQNGIAAPFSMLLSLLKSYLVPLFSRIPAHPDLASIALLLVILWLSLQVLKMLYGVVVFWVTLAVRLLVVGTVVLAALYVWSNGAEQTVADVSEGLAYWVDVWKGEYGRFQAQEQTARAFMMGQQAARASATPSARWPFG